MGRSYFLDLFLFSAVLSLCISQGSGRKLITLENGAASDVSGNDEKTGESNGMIEVLDYTDPEANTNPRAGYLYKPPSSSSPSAPSPKP